MTTFHICYERPLKVCPNLNPDPTNMSVNRQPNLCQWFFSFPFIYITSFSTTLTEIHKQTRTLQLFHTSSTTVRGLGKSPHQPWIFIGRTDAEGEAPILWPHDAKNWLTGKDPNAGKDWRQEEKGTTEDEMVAWHHWLDGHKFEQALGVGDGQGSLACCNPWGRKDWHTAERLNWTELKFPMKVTYKPPVMLHAATSWASVVNELQFLRRWG